MWTGWKWVYDAKALFTFQAPWVIEDTSISTL